MKQIWWLLTLLFSSWVVAQDTAQNLFENYRESLYQIQVIEAGSDNKSAIGSGFQISPDGLLMTNYHVVASFIYHPDKYRLAYLSNDGKRGTLSLHGFDVVNDLALLKVDQPGDVSMPLANQLPPQGAPIFSLGNPHDLGMIVVPGTFNGLRASSYYQRIHFTGSINPGMSGGPVVNALGEVIGVNVATAGNQIGFLVPLDKIETLANRVSEPLSKDQFKAEIGAQLQQNQAELIAELTQHSWTQGPLGKAQVPVSMTPFITCWGNSNANQADARYDSVENRCQLGETIYINPHLQTGNIEIEYEWITTDKVGTHRFYDFFNDSIVGARPGNKAGEEDVTNYQCHQQITTNSHQFTQRAHLCMRAYREFDDLFDVLFVGASLDEGQAGLISHYTLSGVSKASALAFSQHFMEALAWQ